MKKITKEDLKQTSKLWCEKREKKYSEINLFSVSSDLILNNLYFRKMDGVLQLLDNNDYYYKKIYDNMNNNGWDKKYPAKIGIGDRGEVFVHGGNHRMNLLTKLNITNIIFKFVYQKNIKTRVPVFLKSGKNFYPNGLIPKWSKL